MSKSEIARRLAALEDVVRPSEGVAARLDKLSPSDRAIFDQWRRDMDRYMASFAEPGGAYAAYLAGDSGPTLPRHI